MSFYKYVETEELKGPRDLFTEMSRCTGTLPLLFSNWSIIKEICDSIETEFDDIMRESLLVLWRMHNHPTDYIIWALDCGIDVELTLRFRIILESYMLHYFVQGPSSPLTPWQKIWKWKKK